MRPPVAPRPLVPLAAAFASGVLLDGHGWGLVALLAGAASAITGGLLIRDPRLRTLALWLAFATAGALRAFLASGPAPNDISRFAAGRFVTVSGTVATDVEPATWDYTCEMTVDHVTLPDGPARACGGRAAVRLRRDQGVAPPDYGEHLEVRGVLDRPTSIRNVGGFDYGAWLERRGVYATLATRRPADWRHTPSGEPASPVGRLASRARTSLLASMHRLLPPTQAALLGGVLLGARSRMPPQLDDDFAATGTAHVLATAGLHVGILVVLLHWLCVLVRIPRRPAAGMQIATIALYTMMAGGRPSVTRAAIIAILYLLGWLLDRETDGANSLAAAALLLLVVQPLSLFDPGFQLSFATVGTILAVMPLIGRATQGLWQPWPAPMPPWERACRWVLHHSVGMAALSFAAQLGSAPLTAQHFNLLPLIGVPANILVVPALFVLMGAGLAAWPLAVLWPGAAHALALVALGPAARYTIGAAHACAQVPLAAVPVRSPGWLVVGLCYAAIGTAAWWLRRPQGPAPQVGWRAWWRPALAACALLALVVWVASRPAPPPGRLVVSFLDVGQGDAIVLRTPGGHTVVVDTGPASGDDDAGRRVVVPFLRASGIARIDALALTHPDSDHTGGAVSVLSSVGTERLLLSAPETSAEGYRPAVAAAAARRIPVAPLASGQVLRFTDGVVAEVLNPPARLPRGMRQPDNNGSVVLRVRYGGTSILLTGDAGEDAERVMDRGDVSADVLKLGHHGSRSATSPAFLEAVHPRAVVISAGRRNQFGHPNPAVLERLEARGIRVFRTDRQGAVTLASDGRVLRLTTAAP